MKNQILLLSLLAISFASCKKDDKAAPFVYTINGVHDITMESTGTNFLALQLEHSSGTQQPVTISVSGLPNNVTATASPESGTPGFSTVVTFTAANADTGTYNVKVKGTTSGGSVKEYDLKLRITKLSKQNLLIGIWNLTEYGSDDNYNGNLDIGETSPTSGLTVTFSNNNTGYYYDGSSTYPFTWVLVNNDNVLRMSIGSSPIDYLIKTLVSDKLVLMDETTTPPDWAVFQK